MKIIRDTTEFNIENTVVAIGKFDGIHLGHKQVLTEMKKAKEQGFTTVIFTFDPSVTSFFSGKVEKELSSMQEKEEAFAQFGIDILIEYPLTIETANISPENFIEEVLIHSLHVKKIIAGEDISFGKGGKGNANLLNTYGKQSDFTIALIPKICFKKKEISSSRIRQELEKGKLSLVKEMLGEPYSIKGIVKNGKKLGRTIGFPTVNIIPNEEKLLPPRGVYYSTCNVMGKMYCGITNIGIKPTVTSEEKITVETFIFDFSMDIYGEDITVIPVKRLRNEKKFSSVEHLKKQMDKDVRKAKKYFAKDKKRK